VIFLKPLHAESVKVNPGGQYDSPKAGDEYVVVNSKMHHPSGQEQQYNEFDFHFKSGSGNITNQIIVSFENSCAGYFADPYGKWMM
jgi:hypothetical protein